MVRFVTTAYTHMYENSYVGLPGERLRHKSPQELTDVGIRVERWRKNSDLKVAELVIKVNEKLADNERIDSQTYWEYVRGQSRITNNQIRAIAKVLGTTVHALTHYSPGQVPKEDSVSAKPPALIKVDASVERAARRKSAKGKRKEKDPSSRQQYDADEAARMLSEKYGDRVRRLK